MADAVSLADRQTMISSFLEIAVGQTAETAIQFLQATSWRVEEAIQLFYVGNQGRIGTSSSYVPPIEHNAPLGYQNSSGLGNGIRKEYDGDEVRPPLPVIRETLYGDAAEYRAGHATRRSNSAVALRNFEDEMRWSGGVWDREQGGASTTKNSQDSLAALYRPPFALMYKGSFEMAKVAAVSEDKWLLVNLQSNTEFNSHRLNRDTWGNEAVAQTIGSNFIFWQMDYDTTEGRKVCTYYQVVSAPAVLIIDPITGQKMRLWSGMIHPERLLEYLLSYMDNGPRNYASRTCKRRREAAPSATQKKLEAPVMSSDEDQELQQAPTFPMEEDENNADACSAKRRCSYPPLPDEPKADKSQLCRIQFRLPDGRRAQRNFLHSDPVQLLWSFCYTHLSEAKERAFSLLQAIPGCSKRLDYNSKDTIGESGLASSLISVSWV